MVEKTAAPVLKQVATRPYVCEEQQFRLRPSAASSSSLFLNIKPDAIAAMAHPQTQFTQTEFTGASLLRARRTTVGRATAKAQLKRMKDSGQYDAFSLKKKPTYDKSRWPCPPPVYWDSDVAKWIEGACYLLSEEYDAEIDAAVRELADMIRSAQQPDGYLNTWFTIEEPEGRWSNIRDKHEL